MISLYCPTGAEKNDHSRIGGILCQIEMLWYPKLRRFRYSIGASSLKDGGKTHPAVLLCSQFMESFRVGLPRKKGISGGVHPRWRGG
jgi:hypothetical protein